VIAKIAGGGMSAVYLGRRLDPDADVPNMVALKIVRHDVAKDERLVKMFLEEGKLLARLVHPNIVRTLEVGGDAEQDFIAMELMLGKTYAAIHDALVARGVRLNPEIAAWTAARIADALHYAHELTDDAGRPLALVHRDVNPANVFATFNGEVKLFDFGLAKVTAGEASGSQLLAGKLSYLSPEQIMQLPLDRRSDIFSLGTTFWELLTSKRLFRRDTDIDTVRAVQLGPIPDPRTVAPDVPEELARIAKTALERNRDHRYPSAAYLSRELDAFVYTRSSPADMRARLAQLVDTLFPGEQKRQSGWLKPAISSSISRPSMNAVAATPRPGSVSRPMPPELRRDTRETTAVMPNAPMMPQPRSRDSVSIPNANTLRDGLPAVPTARDGVSSVSPVTPRGGIPSVSTPSASMRGATPVARPPSIASPPSPRRPAAPPPAPSRTSSPMASQGPSPPPPPSQRSRPLPRSIPTPSPLSRTDVQTIPPAPDSRTDIQSFAPTIETPAVMPPASPRPPAVTAPPSPLARPPAVTAPVECASAPSVKPSAPPPSNLGPRPKRVPIPLPSRTRTDSTPPKAQSSRKVAADPPDSERTQVDMPLPPDRKR